MVLTGREPLPWSAPRAAPSTRTPAPAKMSPADDKRSKALSELPADAIELPDLPDEVEPVGSAGGQEDSSRKTAEEREAERQERLRQKKLELDRAAGLTGEKRELDHAPLMLRKAAIVLAVASFIPFGTPDFSMWPMNLVGKAIIALGAWIFYQAHVAKAGQKAPGFAAGLAKNNALPGLIVFGVLCLVGLYDWVGIGLTTQVSGYFPGLSMMAEKVLLILAGFTFVHIYDYEHGGKFNPIFPLMFVGALFAGIGAVIIDMKNGAMPGVILPVAAAVAVAFAGLIAIRTMVEAMKEAKAQGELKRQAQQEARKAAREARSAKQR